MKQDNDSQAETGGNPDELITVWGVRRRLVKAYFWLFSLLFILISGASWWLEWTSAAAGTGWATVLMAAMGVAGGWVIWLAAFSIISVEVVYVIAEYIIVDRYRRGFAKGAEGIEQVHQAAEQAKQTAAQALAIAEQSQQDAAQAQQEAEQAKQELARIRQEAELAKQEAERAEYENRWLLHQWQSWYERQQAALRDGRPFTEPPPSLPPFRRNGN